MSNSSFVDLRDRDAKKHAQKLDKKALLDRAFERIIGSQLEKIEKQKQQEHSDQHNEFHRQQLEDERASKQKRKKVSKEHLRLAQTTGLSGHVVALMAKSNKEEEEQDDQEGNKRRKRKKKSKKRHKYSSSDDDDVSSGDMKTKKKSKKRRKDYRMRSVKTSKRPSGSDNPAFSSSEDNYTDEESRRHKQQREKRQKEELRQRGRGDDNYHDKRPAEGVRGLNRQTETDGTSDRDER